MKLRRITICAGAGLALAITNCASGLSGTYESDGGAISLEFKSGKAYVTMLTGTVELDYQVKRDKVILTNHGGNLVLVRHEDGTLEGTMGRMRRKGS